jgi:hypothetical protein
VPYHHVVAHSLDRALRVALPPTGRRRAGDDRPPTAVPLAAAPPCRPREPGPLLRGEDHRLVRPYVVAAEERREAQERRITNAVRDLAEGGLR